jgi:hypothetical protein
MMTICILVHGKFDNKIMLLFRRLCPHDLKCFLVKRDIGMSVLHHGLKLSHDLREVWIAILSNVESLCRVMDIELCINRLFALHRKQSIENMVEFTIYFESIRAAGTCDSMIYVDSNRCEVKCSISVAAFLSRFLYCGR